MTVVEYPPEPDPEISIEMHTATSDADGYFEVTGIEGDGMMYKIRMKKFDGETAEYAGRSMLTEYQVDPEAEDSPMSVRYVLDDITGRSSWQDDKHLSRTFDLTESQRTVTGDVTYDDTAGFDDLTVLKIEKFGSRLEYGGEYFPGRYGPEDEFDAAAGTFELRFDAPANHVDEHFLFVTAYDGDEDQHYGAFIPVTLEPGEGDMDLDISLEPLQGEEREVTAEEGQTFTTAMTEFSLVDEDGDPAEFSGVFGFGALTTMDYTEYWADSETIRWWKDAVDPDDTTFELPVVGAEGVETSILTQEYAPRKAILTADRLANTPVEITISEFSPGALEDLETLDVEPTSTAETLATESEEPTIQLSLYPSGDAADRPHPEVDPISTASLEDFNPLSAPLVGTDTSLRIQDTDNDVVVHFVGLDVVDSQAPDAVFDVEPAAVEDVEEADLSKYADEDGFVRPQGILEAIDDWRDDRVDAQFVLELIDHWRNDVPVT